MYIAWDSKKTELKNHGEPNKAIEVCNPSTGMLFPEINELEDSLGNGILSPTTTTNNKRLTHRQIYLAKEISEQQTIQHVPWVLLVAFNQIYSEILKNRETKWNKLENVQAGQGRRNPICL